MRAKVLGAILSVMFSFLIAGLWYVQIHKFKEYNGLSINNMIRVVPIKGVRGSIYDNAGNIFACDKLHFRVTCIPQELTDKDQIFKRLASLLNCDSEIFYKNFKKNYTAPFAPVMIYPDIDNKTAIILEENKIMMPGIMVDISPSRDYPNKDIACHVLGYIGELNKEELEELKPYGYKIRDLIGKSGVEDVCDIYLRSEDGGMQVEVDNYARIVQVRGYKQPTRGKDVHLTINLQMQKICEQALRGKIGSIVIMNPDTGAILSLASSPSFDPNIFIKPRDSQRIRALFKNSSMPFLNRVVSGVYPPGSIFKVITSTAALEKKFISINDTVTCNGSLELGGKIFKCWNPQGHGCQNLTEALKNSCNVYFWTIGRKTGIDILSHYSSMFGFGKKTGIELHPQSCGFVPNRNWKLNNKKVKWQQGDTMNFSIGQGYLMVTPLQAAVMMSVIANNGYLVKPYIIDYVGEKDNPVLNHKEEKISLALKDETLSQIRTGLYKVVNDSNGTGRLARPSGVTIAGKTGSAQTSSKQSSHAWYAGYTVNSKNKIAFVVMLEHGGAGGVGPAHIVKEIIDEFDSQGLL